MKALILYYSLEGSTEKVAKYLAEELKADIERITPIRDISSKGPGKYLQGGSQVVMKKKPQIEEIKSDISQYDIIYIGSPIWAGSFVPPVRTLMESESIKDKKVAYFYCHRGGARNADKRAEELFKRNNEYMGSYSCLSVSKNYENIKNEIIKWAIGME